MLKLRNLVLSFLIMAIFYNSPIQAEVTEVILKWTPGLCQESCSRGLEQQFRRIKGVTNSSISGLQGHATLKWDPATPFSYRAIEAAMAAIGLSLDDIFITVRGNITHDQRSIILSSTGDNTRFYLMSHPEMVPNRYVEINSPFNRSVLPQVRTELIEAELNHQPVTVTGPLFQPEASPPLFLTIESYNIGELPKAQTTPNFREN